MSRRRMLAGGLSVAGAATLAAAGAARADTPTAAPAATPQPTAVPSPLATMAFYGAHQAGISTPAQDRLVFAALDFKGASTGELRALLQA